jgi:hypothetical protein
MYYPYLRGKQFELIAIREMLKERTLKQCVVPIIEPIKASSTLKSSLQIFCDEDHGLAVIQNPQATAYESFTDDDEVTSLKQQSFFIPAVIGTTGDAINSLAKYANPQSMILLPSNVHPALDWQSSLWQQAIKVIAPDNRSLRRQARNGEVVVLEDVFEKKSRNADYAGQEDQFFSDTHVFYRQDGYTGFSDYSVIGSEYIDKGFAPRAVAIHVVYFRENEELWIRHFVSTTNDDINDVTGKFAEALNALMEWYHSDGFDHNRNDSSALTEFERMYELKQYSGLGVVKKLSIKHHLEIMGRYLTERAEQ